MGKIGLILELFGFLMLFWKTDERPGKDSLKGGGSSTTTAGEDFQLERSFWWKPNEDLKKWIAVHYSRVALGLVIGGVIFQFFD